jgi:flagellar biosynthetic protein FliO
MSAEILQQRLAGWLRRWPPTARWWIGGAALVLLIGAASLASPRSAQTAGPGALAPDWFSGIGLGLSVLLKLGLVIGLIYASLYVLKRWQGGALAGRARQVTLVETTRLSPRQALHLVKVGQRTLLIGATDASLNLLTELAAPEFEAALREARHEA